MRIELPTSRTPFYDVTWPVFQRTPPGPGNFHRDASKLGTAASPWTMSRPDCGEDSGASLPRAPEADQISSNQ
jgi:hypothetical protein